MCIIISKYMEQEFHTEITYATLLLHQLIWLELT